MKYKFVLRKNVLTIQDGIRINSQCNTFLMQNCKDVFPLIFYSIAKDDFLITDCCFSTLEIGSRVSSELIIKNVTVSEYARFFGEQMKATSLSNFKCNKLKLESIDAMSTFSIIDNSEINELKKK